MLNILSPSQDSGEEDGIESPWDGGTGPEPGGATVVIENAGDEDSQEELESEQRGVRVGVLETELSSGMTNREWARIDKIGQDCWVCGS